MNHPTSGLPLPVKITPLGGVGLFGMNMMLFEYAEEVIVVDAGLMFPGHRLPGVNFVIPNFTALRKAAGRIRGIFLTHGHLDHIGALPYLLREMNVPIYGTTVTLAFVAERLREHRHTLCVALEAAPEAVDPDEDGIPAVTQKELLQLIPVSPGVPVTLGPFCVEAIPVTHSIAESVGYAITTPAGCIIHTGDFKLDPTPLRGRLTDAERFIHYGDRGVLALISDSTNAEQDGESGSEAVVGTTFDRLLPEITGRVIVATFASHLHRIDRVAESARAAGRKIFITGKSLLDTARIGRETGNLSIPPEQTRSLDALSQTPDHEVLILTTGSQGEPSSALHRMAMDDHRQIQLKPTDTVILSARVIPGNEAEVSVLINALLRRGMTVLYDKIAPVHVSGHANRDEQRQMIQWTRPRYFIPVHGEYRQMVAHAHLAESAGVARERIILMENGEVIFCDADSWHKGKSVPADGVYVDGKGVGDVDEETLSERRQIGEDGILVITLTAAGRNFRPDVQYFSRGFVCNDPDLPILKEVREAVASLYDRIAQEHDPEVPPPTAEQVATRLKKTLKKRLAKKWDRYPLIHIQTSPGL